MHELPVTESLLEIALRHATQANADRIISLNLVIGQLASVIDDSVQFYWSIIAKDTPAEGAILNFRRIPAQFHCLECDLVYQPGEEIEPCPDCNSSKIEIQAGREFYLESIEIE
jgi:hydrogenase nickel incorporation protein HypA/HybF